MGHLVGKELYRRVGDKVDSLHVRAPWTEALGAVLRELFLADEAELYVAMPYGLATARHISRATGIDPVTLQPLLERMADKGLVVDVLIGEQIQYMPSPLMVGLFEFSMMRAGPDVDSARLAGLFHAYLDEGLVFAANRPPGGRVSPMRALPHEAGVEDHVEILDYERASAIIDQARRFAIGICSCRHEKQHTSGRECETPLSVCTSFDTGADYLIRHGMAREVDRTEVLDTVARSREQGLVLSADNVQRKVGFICHCCSCCCNLLEGVRCYGYPSLVVSSSLIAASQPHECTGCGACEAACPIDAIAMTDPAGGDDASPGSDVQPRVDERICLGCGVCALVCPSGAMRLHSRPARVLHPETTFERVILQCLERGTLANQMFADPNRLTHRVMRAVLGVFLTLPAAKRALMSDALRSRFLTAMAATARRQGHTAALDL